MIDSARRRGRRRHLTLPAAVLLLAALVAGCSDGEAPTSAALDPAAESEVLETWEAYWAAVVDLENAPTTEGPAVARLAEVAAQPIVDGHLAVVRRYERYGLQRVGEPAFRDVEVEGEGDRARVTACLSEDDWGAEVDGEPVEDEARGFLPVAATIERTDGAWRVTERDRRVSIRC